MRCVPGLPSDVQRCQLLMQHSCCGLLLHSKRTSHVAAQPEQQVYSALALPETQALQPRLTLWQQDKESEDT
jgi:hypothetical protein